MRAKPQRHTFARLFSTSFTNSCLKRSRFCGESPPPPPPSALRKTETFSITNDDHRQDDFVLSHKICGTAPLANIRTLHRKLVLALVFMSFSTNAHFVGASLQTVLFFHETKCFSSQKHAPNRLVVAAKFWFSVHAMKSSGLLKPPRRFMYCLKRTMTAVRISLKIFHAGPLSRKGDNGRGGLVVHSQVKTKHFNVCGVLHCCPANLLNNTPVSSLSLNTGHINVISSNVLSLQKEVTTVTGNFPFRDCAKLLRQRHTGYSSNLRTWRKLSLNSRNT